MSFSVYEADAGSDTDRRSGVIDRITTIQSTTKTHETALRVLSSLCQRDGVAS